MSLVSLIQARLDAEVRPYIQAHGGSVEIIDFHDGVLEVAFVSACACCELQAVTFAARVRPALKTIEGVDQVLCASVPYRSQKLDTISSFFL